MNHVGKPERSRLHPLEHRFMPHWRQIRNELNRLPVRHEDWEY
jgi:hypothetical protein